MFITSQFNFKGIAVYIQRVNNIIYLGVHFIWSNNIRFIFYRHDRNLYQLCVNLN